MRLVAVDVHVDAGSGLAEPRVADVHRRLRHLRYRRVQQAKVARHARQVAAVEKGDRARQAAEGNEEARAELIKRVRTLMPDAPGPANPPTPHHNYPKIHHNKQSVLTVFLSCGFLAVNEKLCSAIFSRELV